MDCLLHSPFYVFWLPNRIDSINQNSFALKSTLITKRGTLQNELISLILNYQIIYGVTLT